MAPVVPEQWDAPAAAMPVPRPYGWLSLPLAVVATLLTPRRAGPRLAVTSWGKIVTVSLLAAMIFLVLMMVSFFVTQSHTADRYIPPGTPWTLRPRLVAVAIVESLASGIASSRMSTVGLVSLGAVAFLAWIGVAWLIVPLVPGSRTRRAAVGRALKIALWSALFGPIAWAAVFIVSREDWGPGRWLQHDLDRGVPEVLAVLLIGVAWTGWVWRLSARDVGGPGAPATTPQAPRCRDCAYVLTGLPLDVCCPECGLPVERSTPAARGPTPWAAGPPGVGRVAAYVATAWAVLRYPRDFFGRLPVWAGREAALSFAAWTSWVMGACALAVMLLLGLAAHVTNTFINPDLGTALIGAISLGVLGTRATVAALAWLSSRGGWNASPATIIVTCYASVWLIPITLVAGVVAIADTLFAGRGFWGTATEHLTAQDVWLMTESFLKTVPTLACVVWALVCYRRGLSLTRYAAS